MFLEKELKLLEEKRNSLEKKDINLIISDLDDTIFSRQEQLENNIKLKENRGDAGNIIILEEIGLDNFINENYKGKIFPKIIIDKLNKEYDLIMTAGVKELQEAKIKTLKLDNYNLVIVKQAKEKPFQTINYIVNSLGFIPNKITIYEDRPKYFIENKDLIESFLNTKLEIMFVEMNGNEKNPKIKKIED